MADADSSSSSENGFEPMEVNIPPALARELGKVPGMLAGDEEDGTASERLQQERGEEVEEADDEEALDLKKVSVDYAQYLAVNSRQDKQLLDDRIESVVLRVDEFKKQLETMNENISSSSEKMEDLHDRMKMLKDLFKRIDQVEAFLSVVDRNVDQLEETMSKAEKELDPNKLRKVFSALPGLRRSTSKPDPTTNWQRPKLFKTRDYFGSNTTSSSPGPAGAQSRTLETNEAQVSAISGSSETN